jgi:23S rRNA pseudouridine2605 synthase
MTGRKCPSHIFPMNQQELQELRRERWRVNGQPVRTLDDARAFVESVGFAPMYPTQKPLLIPTFIGAYAGTDESLPTWHTAFADPRTKDATELMVRLLRERSAYEASAFGEENNFLIAASAFPYFYGLVGDRNPKAMPKPGTRSEYSPLARDVFNALQKHGAMSKQQLADRLGGSLSDTALDRALHDLWSRLRITRVDYRPEEGTFWDVLFRWSPDAVRAGVEISVPEALSALVSKYVDAVIAADAAEVEEFFSNMVARAKVHDAVNALLSAREFTMTSVGNRPMLTIAERHHAAEKEALKRSQPIARRPRPRVRAK